MLGQEDFPGGRHGNPLLSSCLGNPMDRGAWQAIVQKVAESDTTEVTEHTHTHFLLKQNDIHTKACMILFVRLYFLNMIWNLIFSVTIYDHIDGRD